MIKILNERLARLDQANVNLYVALKEDDRADKGTPEFVLLKEIYSLLTELWNNRVWKSPVWGGMYAYHGMRTEGLDELKKEVQLSLEYVIVQCKEDKAPYDKWEDIYKRFCKMFDLKEDDLKWWF